MTNWKYRLRQLWWAFSARPLKSAEIAHLQTILTPCEFALFQNFSLSDQRHSLRVLHRLQQMGGYTPELLKAGLLHDIGKVRYNWYVWDRVLVVVGKRWGWQTDFDPTHSPTWRTKPFLVRQYHPAWGAEMVRACGSSPIVVELVGRHQEEPIRPRHPTLDRLLEKLQSADNCS